MATETATIRVSRETRDLLAEQARARGISLSSMLHDVAHDVAREALFRSERHASRADAENPDVAVEESDWETAAGDGVD